MSDEAAAVSEGLDLSRPSAARVYDYYLGGAHNFAVDRDLHVAVALDQLGRRLGMADFPTDDAHHHSLRDWAAGFGEL